MIDVGADGIIGSHAHIVQPAGKYHNGIIAMNLGNFAFPDRYVIKPRLSYYPTSYELQEHIPIVNRLKDVDQLTLKVVAPEERIGAILSIEINNNLITYSIQPTILSCENVVIFCNLSWWYRFKRNIISLFIGHNCKYLQSAVSFASKLHHRLPLLLIAKLKK